MAVLDGTAPHKSSGSGTVVWTDGSGSTCTATFVQSELSWTQVGRKWVEARSRDRHETIPISIELGDNNVEGQITMLISSYKGSANTHPYEAVTFSGNASAWTSVGTGSKKSLKCVLTQNSTADGGGSQTITFAYWIPTSVAVDPAGGEGLALMTVAFVDLENAPTCA